MSPFGDLKRQQKNRISFCCYQCKPRNPHCKYFSTRDNIQTKLQFQHILSTEFNTVLTACSYSTSLLAREENHGSDWGMPQGLPDFLICPRNSFISLASKANTKGIHRQCNSQDMQKASSNSTDWQWHWAHLGSLKDQCCLYGKWVSYSTLSEKNGKEIKQV